MPGPQPLRLIIVDDYATDRTLIRRQFEREFPSVHERAPVDAAGFAEALEAGDFDLVVTDYQLRWTDGLAVLRAVKARRPDCPVIMFTATGNQEVAVAAMKAGVDDYIVKAPQHFIRLPAAARHALERAELRAERQRAEAERARLLAREQAARAEAEAALARAERAERHAAFLAEASRVLAGSLDYEATLESVARLAVPRLADYCIVDLLDTERATRAVAVAHRDPAKEALAREMRSRFPPDPDRAHPVWEAFRTGRPQLIAEVGESWFQAVARSPRHLELMRGLGPRSQIVTPLVARGRALGVITFVYADSGRRYGPADLPLTNELAGRMALAVDNARLYREAQAAEQRYRALVDEVDAIVWEADPATWRFTFVSRRAEELTGYPLAAWLGDKDFWVNLIHPEDREGAVATCLAAMKEGRRAEFEYRAIAKDGRVLWFYDTAETVRDAAGRPERLRGLMIDTTARKQAEAEREQLLRREQAARAEAEAAVRARDAFLARASHELRTPLTSALGTVRLLRRGRPGERPESPDALLAVADRNLTAMAALIEDLLDASKLAAGQETLTRERVDLAEAVGHSLEVVGPQAREKGVALRAAAPAGLALSADRLKLDQVLVNLLANAVKFTPAGGTITVEAEHDGDWVVIRVRDTGEGIAPDQLERIFEPFYQSGGLGDSRVTDRRARRVRGTGLGLAICRQIIGLHGGAIRAESEGPGKGATFVVRLPAPLAGSQAA
jgi:PAS domain S-box-containing protein